MRYVFSAILTKRLGFCRSILRLVGRLDAPDSDLPPLLLGRGHAVGSAQITDTGELLETSNPWLKQFVRDVVFAMQHNHLDADMSLDPRSWMLNARYATTKFKELLNYCNPLEIGNMHRPALTIDSIHHQCPTCLRLFANVKA